MVALKQPGTEKPSNEVVQVLEALRRLGTGTPHTGLLPRGDLQEVPHLQFRGRWNLGAHAQSCDPGLLPAGARLLGDPGVHGRERKSGACNMEMS